MIHGTNLSTFINYLDDLVNELCDVGLHDYYMLDEEVN